MGQAFDRVEVERLVNLYSDLILRVSYSYLKSTHDAQDICQTVFLKVLTGKPDFRSAEHEKAWIIRTTINACKDLLGSAWRSRTCGMEACAEAAAPEVEEGSLLAAVNLLPENTGWSFTSTITRDIRRGRLRQCLAKIQQRLERDCFVGGNSLKRCWEAN